MTSEKEFKPWPKMQELLPLHSGAEGKALKKNIETLGVLENGVYWTDEHGNNWILDGTHRYLYSNGKMDWKEFQGTEEEALEQGVFLNVVKRNLSFEQINELQEKLRQNKERRRGIAIKLLEDGKSQKETGAIVGVPRRTISDWKQEKGTNGETANSPLPVVPDQRVKIPKKEHKTILARSQKGETQEKIAADYKITRSRIGKIIRQEKARQEIPDPVETPPYPIKLYKCIIVDPPWPIKKIEREERPDQGATLDYPTMSVEKIGNLPIKNFAHPHGCHVYLWTTQKYLPNALKVFKNWGVKYQCLLTWVKPTGMTPFSWMYNTEHVLFGRIGSLDLEQFGIKLSFEERSREHSRKPEIRHVRQRTP